MTSSFIEDIIYGGLYTEFEFSENEIELLFNFIFNVYNIDVFCVHCKEKRVFQKEEDSYNNRALFSNTITFNKESKKITINNYIKNKTFNLEFSCAMNKEHKIYYNFKTTDNLIIKIGQYPSIADLHIYDFKKYYKILPDEKLKELSKSVGLYSHGIGAGSFVYLRRIFEYILEEAHQRVKDNPDWDEDNYSKLRVKERLEVLKIELPDYMTSNSKLYSVLSMGIHLWDEEECLNYYDIVKFIILFVLDDKLKNYENEQKRKEMTNALNKINN